MTTALLPSSLVSRRRLEDSWKTPGFPEKDKKPLPPFLFLWAFVWLFAGSLALFLARLLEVRSACSCSSSGERRGKLRRERDNVKRRLFQWWRAAVEKNALHKEHAHVYSFLPIPGVHWPFMHFPFSALFHWFKWARTTLHVLLCFYPCFAWLPIDDDICLS